MEFWFLKVGFYFLEDDGIGVRRYGFFFVYGVGVIVFIDWLGIGV